MKIEELINIVGSGIKNMDNLNKSGDKWLHKFQEMQWIKSNYRILDYGAGLGRISIPFNSIAKVVSVDGNPDMIKYLKEKGLEVYHKDDSWDKLGLFDFVISTYVLQHNDILEAQDIVEKIGNITNLFYFTYPIYKDLKNDVRKNYIYYKDAKKLNLIESHNTSRYFVDESEFKVLFEKSSFKLNTLKKTGFVNLYTISK